MSSYVITLAVLVIAVAVLGQNHQGGQGGQHQQGLVRLRREAQAGQEGQQGQQGQQGQEGQQGQAEEAAPSAANWTTCDVTTTPRISCHDCNTRLVCKPIGGLLIVCSNPSRPHCVLGTCSPVPSAECAQA